MDQFVQLWPVFGVIASGGAAWGAAKAALNGTRARVISIEASVQNHVMADEAMQRDMLTRMARIETKIDLLMESKKLRDS